MVGGWMRGVRVLAAVVAATLVLAPAALAQTSKHYTGTLPDGGTWVADVPSTWNGTLLVYGHGMTANTAGDARVGLGPELLSLGYALTGSSYDPNGPLFAMNSAARDQFETIAAVEDTVLPAPPTSVIAWGESEGGLVAAMMNQADQGQLTGTLSVCGQVAGGSVAENDSLAGAYAVNTLLGSGPPVQLVGYQSAQQAQQAASELMAIAQTAQTTPAGRARLALASALWNVTTWTAVDVGGYDTNPSVTPPLLPPLSNNYSLWEQEQYETMFAPGAIVVGFGTNTAYDIEQAEGGQPAWNAGVNFAAVLGSSPYLKEVTALYATAGLNLGADLQTLTADANIAADPVALSNLLATSTPTGVLKVPALDLHTLADQYSPVQDENYYAQLVNAAGDSAMLGQAYIFRSGHCNINAAELIAGLRALGQRITTGSWGNLLAPSSLNAAGAALKIGTPDFFAFSPPALTTG